MPGYNFFCLKTFLVLCEESREMGKFQTGVLYVLSLFVFQITWVDFFFFQGVLKTLKYKILFSERTLVLKGHFLIVYELLSQL